jgi:hypothetical protein
VLDVSINASSPGILGGGGEAVTETTYAGSATGWTLSNGSGTASAGTEYAVALGNGAYVSPVYPTSSHPRIYRDVTTQLAGMMDWSVTFRVVGLMGSTDGRMMLAVGASDDSRGVEIVLAQDGTVELGSWISTTYTAAATAAGTLPLDGTGWCRLLSRGGVITAQRGTSAFSDVAPTSWTQVGGSVVLVGLTPQRMTIFLAQWAGTGLMGAVDDITVREGM